MSKSWADYREVYAPEKYSNRSPEQLANAIAWYMMAVGTQKTTEGNWGFYWEELDEIFGTDLEHDRDLCEKILDKLNPEVVAVDDATLLDEGFDLCFYLDYCPGAYEWVEVE